MKKTLFVDIDGTLIKHQGSLTNMVTKDMKILSDVIEKFNQWNADGHKIILTTGRPESMRKLTIDGLLKLGLFYDQLIMGITRGERIVINDRKPSHKNMRVARAIEINRNDGLKNVDI